MYILPVASRYSYNLNSCRLGPQVYNLTNLLAYFADAQFCANIESIMIMMKILSTENQMMLTGTRNGRLLRVQSPPICGLSMLSREFLV